MVRALHREGIEVILDVVYNHTGEGNQLGPTLCFRGIDNASYYRLVEKDRRYYMDYTGCGNTLDMNPSAGSSFDHGQPALLVVRCTSTAFASTLPLPWRASSTTSTGSGLFRHHPAGPGHFSSKAHRRALGSRTGGYQVGNFPSLWAEWNAAYRDTVRRFWKGDEDKSARSAFGLTGLERSLRSQWPPALCEHHFVTAHDGFYAAGFGELQ